MKMIIQLLDYEAKFGQETRFVVHEDDTEDMTVEQMRQCFRAMNKEIKEKRKALAERSTAENNQQGQKYLQ